MCEDFLRRMHGNLILYPEGTRSCNGAIQTFKKGAGLFAVDLGVPVVPAHIQGAHNILAKGKLMPRPGTVTVRFGEPLTFKPNQFDPRWGRGARRAAVELLEQRIHGLSRSSPARDVIGPSEQPVKDGPAPIFISAVAQGGGKTINNGPRQSVGAGRVRAEYPRDS